MQGKKEKQAYYYNRNTRNLKPLQKGDVVRVKPVIRGEKRWKLGRIKDVHSNKKYSVETENGFITRNRQVLRKTHEVYDKGPYDAIPSFSNQRINRQRRRQATRNRFNLSRSTSPPPWRGRPILKTRYGRVSVPPKRYGQPDRSSE